MFKNTILCFVLLTLINPISLKAGHCQAIHSEIEGLYYQEESSLHSTLQKYSSSIIPGFVVGVNMGMFCAVFDHLVPPLWPLFWLGSFGLRTKIINDISSSYEKNHHRHDKVLMELTALVFSWVSYYKMYDAVHGNPPF